MDGKRFKGWKPSLPDFRDFPFAGDLGAPLPAEVDLREHFPEPLDQSDLGSCTAHAVLSAFRYLQVKQGMPDFQASRLATYYMTRAFEGTEDSDAGAEIRDAIKIVLADGIFPEELWPYDIAKFKERPPQTLYHEALKHQAVEYQNIAVDGSSFHIRHALAQGFPVIFGVSVFSSFESDAVERTGVVPMPQRKERLEGGHCLLAVGYHSDRYFIVRNSWGSYGDGGYLYMPFDYVSSPRFGSDYWIIRSVT